MSQPHEPRICDNGDCGRKAQPGERLCESCAIERSLFRRDERFGSAGADSRKGVGGVESVPR